MSSTTILLLIAVPIGVLGVMFLVTIAVAGVARRGSAIPPELNTGMNAGMNSGMSAGMNFAGRVPAQAQAVALELVRQGKLIQAVKEVRQATGLSLKEAKDFCEALRDGRVPPQPVVGGGMLSDRVRAFRDAGDHASAVAMVRAETGMSQSEAVRFVNALD